MPVRLTHPYQTVTLDLAKVAAIKIEENSSANSHWIEVWAILGREVEGKFIQYADPLTGNMAWRYYKIEDGNHPLSPNVGLGKCQSCAAWFRGQTSGVCPHCGGEVKPYDGWTRLESMVPSGATIREAIARAVYTFLLAEQVPDPDTWELVKLLDGELE